MRLHAPDDEVHAVRQTEPVPPRLNEVAAFDEAVEQALDRRALFARNLQPLEQLARRRRVIDFVADRREELVLIQQHRSTQKVRPCQVGPDAAEISQPPCAPRPL